MLKMVSTAVLCTLIGAGANRLIAEDEKKTQGFFNLKFKTAGGKQLWTDELVFHDWRIQRNSYTGHYRLLDNKDVRHAAGNFEHCKQQLEKAKQRLSLAPITGKVVLVLHGLGRTRKSMAGLCKYLRQQGDYTVLNVGYASTRHDLATHARSLDRIVTHLESAKEINFVAHSLGNLVIRHYLGDHTDASKGLQPDSRIHRVMMLAPPNNGAKLAVKFKNNPLLAAIWGKSGSQLAKDWSTLQQRLATPQCQFAVIAGGRGDRGGTNPLLPGDDDLVVTVEETRLPGARDFVVVPVFHTFLMDNLAVQQYVLEFLRHGHFVAEDQRQPIKAETPSPTDAP